MTFTTRTGQTGRDAYIYEAAEIANLQRELDARFQRLRKTVLEESPELMPHKSDFAFSGASKAKTFLEHIQHGCRCSGCSAE